ncbi:MAG: DUF362 domain-containing protein [Lentisphaerae bacterium]|nr:DUF362 domain-containing protein [Lentisphaerota bacterium]
MASKVYFKKLESCCAEADISAAARQALECLLEKENPGLLPEIPLKLHFGERGNRTYIPQSCYTGVIDLLESRGSKLCYAETTVLYGGSRANGENHRKLAADHGFDRLPVVIADGNSGEDAVSVKVPNGRHFQSASLATLLAKSEQTVVLSHFKGHMLAGFGGAMKQLSMGFASKGGKMAMHLGVKPRIRTWLCKSCGLCAKRCNENAITKGEKSYIIDPEKCIGCGACYSICPHHSVSILSLGGLWNALTGGRVFREKLIEYALAAHTGKKNIYINFCINITNGCDCEPHPMRRCIDDIGIFVSLDPLAVDQACYDAVAAKGKKFRGKEQLHYAEKIGVGTTEYEIVEL